MTHQRICRYCTEVAVCKTCNFVIDCKNITPCSSCGGIYGRPKDGIIAAGCIIIDYQNEPMINLVLEVQDEILKSTINDIGGKYDADKDIKIADTIFREAKEEFGILLFLNGHEPYTDSPIMKTVITPDGIQITDTMIYRCILIENHHNNKYIRINNSPENPMITMKLSQFLKSIKSKAFLFESRIKSVMDAYVNFSNVPHKDQTQKITMYEYLLSILNRSTPNQTN